MAARNQSPPRTDCRGVGRLCRRPDEKAVAELWRVCVLVPPWNDPLRDIGSARANASSDNLRGSAFPIGRRKRLPAARHKLDTRHKNHTGRHLEPLRPARARRHRAHGGRAEVDASPTRRHKPPGECCSARGLRADRRDKLLKWIDTGGQNCTPNNKQPRRHGKRSRFVPPSAAGWRVRRRVPARGRSGGGAQRYPRRIPSNPKVPRPRARHPPARRARSRAPHSEGVPPCTCRKDRVPARPGAATARPRPR